MAEDNFINKDNTISYYASVTSSYVKEIIKPLDPVLFPFERHIYFTGNARQEVYQVGSSNVTYNINPDRVGSVVAISGSRMVFNGIHNYNEVVVMDKVPQGPGGRDGTWAFRIHLTGPVIGEGSATNKFGETDLYHPGGLRSTGRMITIYDKYVLVGNTHEIQNKNDGHSYRQGVAYIFASKSEGHGGDGQGWVRTRFYNTQNSSKNVGGAKFGASMLMTDDMLVVGSSAEYTDIDPSTYPPSAPSRKNGGVYVYNIKGHDFESTNDGTGSLDGGNYVQFITSSFGNAQGKSLFGRQLAYDRKNGNMIVAATSFCDVFQSNSAEGWHLKQTLTSQEFSTKQPNGSYFGQVIDACDDFLIVGAPQDETLEVGQGVLEGSATIFKWNGSQYVRNVCLTGSCQGINNKYHYFGRAVGIVSSSFGYYAAVCENYSHTGSDPDGAGNQYGDKMAGHVLVYRYNEVEDDWDYDAPPHLTSRYRLTGSTTMGPNQSYPAAYGGSLQLWSDGQYGLKLVAGAEDMIPHVPPLGTTYAVENNPSYYTGWNQAGTNPTRHDARGVVTIHEVSQSIEKITEVVGFAPPMKLAARGSFNLRGQKATGDGLERGGGKLHRTFIGEQKS